MGAKRYNLRDENWKSPLGWGTFLLILATNSLLAVLGFVPTTLPRWINVLIMVGQIYFGIQFLKDCAAKWNAQQDRLEKLNDVNR